MLCLNCNQEVNEDAFFCSYCGSQIKNNDFQKINDDFNSNPNNQQIVINTKLSHNVQYETQINKNMQEQSFVPHNYVNNKNMQAVNSSIVVNQPIEENPYIANNLQQNVMLSNSNENQIEEKKDKKTILIIGGIVGALLLICCCCLPFVGMLLSLSS